MTKSIQNRINPVIYALVCWFGSAALMGSYSAWVEMSIFTQRLPERWTLASVLIVTIQISSIGPLIFMLLDRCLKIPIRHGVIIQISIIICALMYLPMFLAWNKTAQLFGSEHSITLISTIFVLGMISIGSDIVWLPYMSTFQTIYLPAYFVGASLSGLFSSLLSVIQGSSTYTCELDQQTGELAPRFNEPRFSVSTFYLILFIWICGAVVSFYLLNNHFDRINNLTSGLFQQKGNNSSRNSVDNSLILEEQNGKNISNNQQLPNRTSRKEDICLLICIGLVAAQMNTLLPSVQSYASIPYSQNTYFWAMILTTLCQPVAAFSAGAFPLRKLSVIVLLVIVCTSSTLITVLIAFQSPNPWLKESIFGSILTIFFQIIGYFFGSYLRTVIIETFRDGKPDDDSRLFWAGLTGQIGSFIGTLLVFPAVNIFNLFESAPQC